MIVDLPDDVEERKMKDMEPDELRIALLRKGINPYKEVAPREWNEHQVTFQSFRKIPVLKRFACINTVNFR